MAIALLRTIFSSSGERKIIPPHLDFERYPQLKKLKDSGASEEQLRTSLQIIRESKVYDFQLDHIFDGMAKIIQSTKDSQYEATSEDLKIYADYIISDLQKGKLMHKDWYNEIAEIFIKKIQEGKRFNISELPKLPAQIWTWRGSQDQSMTFIGQE